MEFDIKEKLGPLPIWGWGLIFGAAALAFYYVYARGNSGSSPVSASDGMDIGYVTKGIADNAAETDKVETNETWLADASYRVSSAAGASISDVRAALYKFLTGQDYTQAEKAWIDRALSLAGSPPQGTTGSGKATPNPPTVIKEQVKVPVKADSYITTRASSVYTSLTGTKRMTTLPKGARVNVVVGGSPTRYRVLSGNGFGYIPKTNVRKV